jgi:hypothetical protein
LQSSGVLTKLSRWRSPVRPPIDYNSRMNREDLIWLAGYLEGEGSFMPPVPSAPNRPTIQVAATDEDVIARVSALWGVSYWRSSERRNPAWKPYFRVVIRGARAVELMRDLRPLMGNRRQQQIDRAIDGWAPKVIHRLREEDQDRILALLKAGYSYRSIGREVGFSRTAVYNVAARHGIIAQPG